jgi:hypothetical protein
VPETAKMHNFGYSIRPIRPEGMFLVEDLWPDTEREPFCGKIGECLDFLAAAARPPVLYAPDSVDLERMVRSHADTRLRGENAVIEPKTTETIDYSVHSSYFGEPSPGAKVNLRGTDEDPAWVSPARREANTKALFEAQLAAARIGGSDPDVRPASPILAGMDLEDVLDTYRLEGRQCGVQVFSKDEVVAWTGDIERAQDHNRLRIRMGGYTEPPCFHACHGRNALEQAARWLIGCREADLRRNGLPSHAGGSRGEIGRG